MKSYLGLVSKYAKAHKQKSRLTIICIAVSVMLVTAIFSMADLSIKSQINTTISTYGNWHLIIHDITEETAAEITNEDNVHVADWLGLLEGATYQGKELVVQSSGEELAEQMSLSISEGTYPSAANEAAMDISGLTQYGLSIGDTISVDFPDGQTKEYKITGTFNNFSTLQSEDSHGLQLTREGMHELSADLYDEFFYLKFNDGVNIRQAISELQATYGLSEEQLQTNVMLLALMGQSDDTTVLEIYITAIVLFILVSMAGIFMIASSFNMSILERTQFFGMLRCLGATKKQIKRYIRVEGLQYCVKAIPIGVVLGCVLTWGAVFILDKLDSQYLPEMQMFQISLPGIAAGIILGLFVVMIASGSPAKKAAKVSPQAAVTGNINQTNNLQFNKAINTRTFHVDTAMGVHHAFSNKRSMVLITGSFAISIIMFLCFSVLISFMDHALSPLKPYAPDMAVESSDGVTLLPTSLKQEIANVDGVDKAYGRMFYTDISANIEQSSNTATIMSYDEPQFEWANDLLVDGSIDEVQNGNAVLIDYSYAEEYGWKVGDHITFTIGNASYDVPIAAIVSDVPFDSTYGEWIFICSEQTFTAMTGVNEYSIIEIQSSSDVSGTIRTILSSDMNLLDYQQRNEEVQNGYLAAAVFVYGFLAVIALVALINIVNTVNASVSSRMNNYGVMRAVGMSGKQLRKVVRAEASSYALTGCVVGGILGIVLHRVLFEMLVTSMWGEPWKPPIMFLVVTVGAAIITTMIAVIFPAKKIEKTDIVNVVNAT